MDGVITDSWFDWAEIEIENDCLSGEEAMMESDEAEKQLPKLKSEDDIVEDPDSSPLAVDDVNSAPCDSMEEANTSYRLIKGGTKRGKDMLFHDSGFSYTMKSARPTGITWRCSSRWKSSCTATLRQAGEKFTLSKEHNHEPAVGKEAAVTLCMKVKEAARCLPHQSAMAIVQAEMLKEQFNPYVPRASSLKRQANRYCQDIRPTSLDFKLEVTHIPDTFLRKDIVMNQARHLIFATSAQLKLLETSRTWYMDGTSHLVSRPFVQLFSINVFIKSKDCMKLVPSALVLMSRTCTKDYEKIFKAISSDVVPGTVMDKIVLDYETATWRALDRIFPLAKKTGCCFYFHQAIKKKVQAIGLAEIYRENRATKQVVHKLMAMCLLPPTLMKNKFNKLYTNAGNDKKLSRLLDYLKKNLD